MAEGHGRLGKRVRGPNFVYRRSKKQQEKRDKKEKEKEFKLRMRRGGYDSLTDKEWKKRFLDGKDLPKVRRVGKGYVTSKKDALGWDQGPALSHKKWADKEQRKSERKVGKGYVISKNRSKNK